MQRESGPDDQQSEERAKLLQRSAATLRDYRYQINFSDARPMTAGQTTRHIIPIWLRSGKDASRL